MDGIFWRIDTNIKLQLEYRKKITQCNRKKKRNVTIIITSSQTELSVQQQFLNELTQRSVFEISFFTATIESVGKWQMWFPPTFYAQFKLIAFVTLQN